MTIDPRPSFRASSPDRSTTAASRRGFLQASFAAGAAAALGLSAPAWVTPGTAVGDRGARHGGGLRILILGGTSFLGPAVTEAAKARGHSITTFNRGKTEKRMAGFIDDDVEKLYGNRDPNLQADEADPESPKGLASLEGKRWDAVVDTSGYYPRMVKASAELLASNVKHYVFISTVSVYAGNATANADESDPLATIADPTVESMGNQYENYGALKALCEQAAEAAMPGRVTVVRPGYIVGPGDPTDRFTYWPVRLDRGGEVLTPGAPTDPIQIIDVRDLGAFIVKLIEDGTMGNFNAVGPKKPQSWGEVLQACQSVAAKPSTLTWIPNSFLEENQTYLPIWLPYGEETAGFHTRSNAKAIAAGLAFRPTATIARDILEWFPKEVERRVRVTNEMHAKAVAEAKAAGKEAPASPPDPTQLRAGLPPAEEAELLKKWHEKQPLEGKQG